MLECESIHGDQSACTATSLLSLHVEVLDLVSFQDVLHCPLFCAPSSSAHQHAQIGCRSCAVTLHQQRVCRCYLLSAMACHYTTKACSPAIVSGLRALYSVHQWLILCVALNFGASYCRFAHCKHPLAPAVVHHMLVETESEVDSLWRRLYNASWQIIWAMLDQGVWMHWVHSKLVSTGALAKAASACRV